MRSLHALTPLDYLVTLDDEVAHRLIRPELRRFVEDDLAAGGVLIETLLEYAACDLNAKLAAEHLHVHVNTAYYRLDTAADRTGRNVRSFTDLQETIIAIRMLTARGNVPTSN